MKKKIHFTLIELPVVTSHFCCDWLLGLKKSKGKRMFSSPAREQVKLYSFTLIELLVIRNKHLCLSENKNNTSLRPDGRTSRLPQANS